MNQYLTEAFFSSRPVCFFGEPTVAEESLATPKIGVTCDSGSLATSRGHLRLETWVTCI